MQALIKMFNCSDAFATSLKQSKGRPKYSFYDGPPFATGLPHYGHILAGTYKVLYKDSKGVHSFQTGMAKYSEDVARENASINFWCVLCILV